MQHVAKCICIVDSAVIHYLSLQYNIICIVRTPDAASGQTAVNEQGLCIAFCQPYGHSDDANQAPLEASKQVLSISLVRGANNGNIANMCAQSRKEILKNLDVPWSLHACQCRYSLPLAVTLAMAANSLSVPLLPESALSKLRL